MKSNLDALAKDGMTRVVPERPCLSVGMGTCGIGNGADLVRDAMKKAAGKNLMVKETGCFGFCAREPLVMLYLPGKPTLLFADMKPAFAAKLAAEAATGKVSDKTAAKALAKISSWDFHTSSVAFGAGYDRIPEWNEIPFWKGQAKFVLRNSGLIDPGNVAEYVAAGGYRALEKALSGMKPEDVVQAVLDSGLRGRGGAGFPTGKKWDLLRKAPGNVKYLICNADEGDPGAYMNRNEIESDPHMLLEGMLLGAYATGAESGFVYIRAEYPLAVERLSKAIADAREAGLLGKNILGSKFSFDLDIVKGAGAFVCGEETALIASAEGKAGRPLPRPPFPAQRGYKGAPTNINNVETWCNVPVIVLRGADYFRKLGTGASPGTKVFSLVGKVKNTGLVELPLGTPLGDIVYGMGGGAGKGNRIRAVQTGGPSGGCIPAELFSSTVDYEGLAKIGAIMGSGGMVALDRENCMVDIARYFVSFTAAESCGKCTPCREGLSQMLRILTDVSRGKASESDLTELESLALAARDASLCALGQTAANPVLTTLKYFRPDFMRHIEEKRCEAGVCESLFQALCENSCPLHMNIPGYLALLDEGRIEDAFELTLRDNPLPGTVGRVCHFHCQMRCRRDTIDDPVAQGEIHRYLADTMYKTGREAQVWDRLVSERLPPTGKKIAVVGAGPAGLAASFWLSRLGHEVTVLDSHAEAGGILRYGIPAYRLPKDVLDKELGLWKRLGVKFKFKTKVGTAKALKELAGANDAVVLATGASADRRLGIPGEELTGVRPGYEWLEAFAEGKRETLGKRSLVIGGGNVAIDAARTLVRMGNEVTVAYRRSKDDLPANAKELEGAVEEGIRFRYMIQPEEILGEGGKVNAVRFRVMEAGPLDESGRPRPVPSRRTEEIACDDAFVAVGEFVDSAELAKAGVWTLKDGRIDADPRTLTAGIPKFWAAGDAVTGPATVSEAMGLGKDVARSLDEALMGRKAFQALFRDFLYDMTPPSPPEIGRRKEPRQLPPGDRVGNFSEISAGYSGEDAKKEASRCLRCDIRSDCMSPWR